MSLVVKCDRCGDELYQPSALVFSSPINSQVKKFHICAVCEEYLFLWIELPKKAKHESKRNKAVR